jgi:hypothetical protein
MFYVIRNIPSVSEKYLHAHINYMEHIPSLDANNRSIRQEIPHHL